MQSCRWVFTLNNYTEDDERRLEQLASDHCKYIIYGREIGANGTPHLQGFVILGTRRRLGWLRESFVSRAHWECARGTSCQAADYCKKDGNYVEFGTAPTAPKRKSESISDFCDWVRELKEVPKDNAIANQYPGLFVRHGSKLKDLSVHLLPKLELVQGELKEWQEELLKKIDGEYNDRVISFYVDRNGGCGKTWFCRYMLTNRNEDVQVFSSGKKEDIAHAVDITKSVFLFNIPKGGMEYLSYNILECLKDRVVFSGKYNSCTKVMLKKTTVVVLCNEDPDWNKLTVDRYDVINL